MRIEEILVELIDEDPEQPRYKFDSGSLNDLMDSIGEVGLLNPIKVRPVADGRFKIVFGNRRYKACQALGFKSIPCILSESQSDFDIFIEQLTENIQRASLTPIEEAESFSRLLNDDKWKISRTYLSSKLGKTERYISQKLDLLVFGQEVRQLIHGGTDILKDRLTEQQALSLKKIPIEYRDPLALKVSEEQIPVVDVKRIAELFCAEDISPKTKEILLREDKATLLKDWTHYQDDKKQRQINDVTSFKPEVASVGAPIPEPVPKLGDFQELAIQRRMRELLSRVPSYRPWSTEILEKIDHMTLDSRNELVKCAEALTNLLESHIEQCRSVLDRARSAGMKRVK